MNFWRQKLKPPEMEIDKVTEELKEFSFVCMKAHVRGQGPKRVPRPIGEYLLLFIVAVGLTCIGILVGYHLFGNVNWSSKRRGTERFLAFAFEEAKA